MAIKSLRLPSWAIKPYAKWFDIWIGAYYDQYNEHLYLQPLPMLGLRIDTLALKIYIGQARENQRCLNCGARWWEKCTNDCIPF